MLNILVSLVKLAQNKTKLKLLICPENIKKKTLHFRVIMDIEKPQGGEIEIK